LWNNGTDKKKTHQKNFKFSEPKNSDSGADGDETEGSTEELEGQLFGDNQNVSIHNNSDQGLSDEDSANEGVECISLLDRVNEIAYFSEALQAFSVQNGHIFQQLVASLSEKEQTILEQITSLAKK